MSLLSRREFMGVAGAAAALFAGGTDFRRAIAQARIGLEDITRFDAKGQVTLLHLTDLHAQLVPLYFREPSINLGVGDAAGQPPHITGKAFLERFGIAPGSLDAYMLTSEDFGALARTYGRVGGLDRIATLVAADPRRAAGARAAAGRRRYLAGLAGPHCRPAAQDMVDADGHAEARRA